MGETWQMIVILDYCWFLGVQEYSPNIHNDLHYRGTQSIF
jgi:hypothetical protein